MQAVSSVNNSELIQQGLLAELIHELNIFRRQGIAYPAGHPVVGAAADRVLCTLQPLLDHAGQLTLGIDRDTLLLGEISLAPSRSIRDFAHMLCDLGITTLSIQPGLTSNELYAFIQVLGCKREQIRQAGGITTLLEHAGVRHLMATEIDYRCFRLTEETEIGGHPHRPADLAAPADRHALVRGLLDGSIDLFADHAGNAGDQSSLHDLAAVLNSLHTRAPAETGPATEALLGSFLKRLELEQHQAGTVRTAGHRLQQLVNVLNPALRQQFLSSTLSAVASLGDASLDTLAWMPKQLVVDALSAVNRREEEIPSMVLGLLARLFRHGNQSAGYEPAALDQAELDRRMAVILRAEQYERFVSELYRRDLNSIVSNGSNAEQESEESAHLRDALMGQQVEAKIGAIILEVLEQTVTLDDDGRIGRNLSELCSYFLQTGDFLSLLSVSSHLSGTDSHKGREIRAAFSSTQVIQSMLDAPSAWGKEHFQTIRQIISRVGEPYTAPLLDRLADEPSISLRRYYMECLMDLGEPVRAEALARLQDSRWYFVRNLVILLRNLPDRSTIKPLQALLGHPHPRVRLEAQRTLLSFRDPEAERVLIRNLTSGDHATRLAAIQLAELSSSPQTLDALLHMLRSGGFSAAQMECKLAVLQTLGSIGSDDALPELTRLLTRSRLFHPIQLQRLKLEVVRCLGRYQSPLARRILAELARTGPQALAASAREILQPGTGRGV